MSRLHRLEYFVLLLLVVVFSVWLGGSHHHFSLYVAHASNINLPLLYFGLIIYSPLRLLCSVRRDFFCFVFEVSSLTFSPLLCMFHFFLSLWRGPTHLQRGDTRKCFSSQRVTASVVRRRLPVAPISLSFILISFLTVLISDCSVGLCPLDP